MQPPTVAGIGLAAVIVAGGVIPGTHLGRTRQRAAPPPATGRPAQPAEVPRTLTATTAAAPLVPGCPDPAQLSRMPLRDRLAQLLMVRVTDEADARSVVTGHKVSGVFITSWTDLSMLTSGALSQLATSTTPLPLAVSVDEEGGSENGRTVPHHHSCPQP